MDLQLDELASSYMEAATQHELEQVVVQHKEFGTELLSTVAKQVFNST